MKSGGPRRSGAARRDGAGLLAASSLLLATSCSSCPETPTPPAAPRSDEGPASPPRPQELPASGPPLEQLRTTLGRLEWTGNAWLHAGPKLRATFPRSRGDSAVLRFKFLGSSQEASALASGQMRRQLGLKLRARDSCNLLYVMWRFDTGGIVVQAKSNQGTRHEQCGNEGYRTVRPFWSTRVEPPAPGTTHELAARIEAGVVEVSVDSREVLRANLDPRLVPATGEAGLRSDNVRFELHGFTAGVSGWPEGSALDGTTSSE